MLEKQQLLEKIKSLEIELKTLKSCKRYWLVFKEKPEEFEEKSKNALPLLKEEKELEISTPFSLGQKGWDRGTEETPTNIILEKINPKYKKELEEEIIFLESELSKKENDYKIFVENQQNYDEIDNETMLEKIKEIEQIRKKIQSFQEIIL